MSGLVYVSGYTKLNNRDNPLSPESCHGNFKGDITEAEFLKLMRQ